MQEETERMVTAVAQDVSKGLVSYDRARRQLVEWGRAGRTIDVGEAIEWLDRNVKKFGYEDAEVDGVIAPVRSTILITTTSPRPPTARSWPRPRLTA